MVGSIQPKVTAQSFVSHLQERATPPAVSSRAMQAVPRQIWLQDLVDLERLGWIRSERLGFLIRERRSNDTRLPALTFHPLPGSERYRTFYADEGRFGGIPFEVIFEPGQLLDENSEPIAPDEIALFHDHGSRWGFEALSLKDAATLTVEEICRVNQDRRKHSIPPIRWIALNVCGQRDYRFFFLRWSLLSSLGPRTNAHVFQGHVDRSLAARNLPTLQSLGVLASDRPGIVATHGSYRPVEATDDEGNEVLARFVPVSNLKGH